MKVKKFTQYLYNIILMVMACWILASPKLMFDSEYLVHMMGVSFLVSCILFFRNNFKLMFLLLGLTSMICVSLKNESNSDLIQPIKNSNLSFKVVHFNLSNINNPFELVTEIEREQPDIISLQEFTPDWKEMLETGIDKSYLYRYYHMRVDPFGKALLSRIPIESIDTLNRYNFEDLKFIFETKGIKFNVYSTYIIPPLDDISTSKCKDQLTILRRDISNQKIPSIALGEYNMVYWTNLISDFRSGSGLNNSRKDVIPAGLKMPYDHIFYSNDFNCLKEGDLVNSSGSKTGYFGIYQIKENENIRKELSVTREI